jgi:hypothetical protein
VRWLAVVVAVTGGAGAVAVAVGYIAGRKARQERAAWRVRIDYEQGDGDDD